MNPPVTQEDLNRVFANIRPPSNGDDGEISVSIGRKHIRRRYTRKLADTISTFFHNRSFANYTVLQRLLEGYRVDGLYGGSFSKDENSGAIYLTGTDIPLPASMVNMLQGVVSTTQFTALKNFWTLTLMNPDVSARDAFIDYVKTYGIVITTHGYAILYKAVTHKQGDNQCNDLISFVATEYLRRKREGKSTLGLYVYDSPNGEYFVYPHAHLSAMDGAKYMGTLQELFDNIGKVEDHDTVYTDKHSRSMSIKLGQVVVKRREECDSDINNECSRGLHVGSYKYVKHFASTDDSILACLVNPAHVVAVPSYDTSKMRVCEYFPYALMERDKNGDWAEIGTSFLEEDYCAYERASLIVDWTANRSEEESRVVSIRMTDLSRVNNRGRKVPVATLDTSDC